MSRSRNDLTVNRNMTRMPLKGEGSYGAGGATAGEAGVVGESADHRLMLFAELFPYWLAKPARPAIIAPTSMSAQHNHGAFPRVASCHPGLWNCRHSVAPCRIHAAYG